MFVSKLVIFCVLIVWVVGDEEVQLAIPQGVLKGLIKNTVYNTKKYHSFKGIPFAKPCVGPDKFKLPEPAGSWEGILDATEHRPACPFYCMIKQGLIGNDDCLYLNIYSSNLDKNAKQAVMVWFHGGGFNAGSADDDIFGPDFLVEQDVVLVTVNSRLGAIGFLNTEDAAAPGNAGLKDQVMALKWIKDNIQNFGGCPNRVTIFGQSSGASSVQYHMMSPMSQGLFSKAIQESGSAVNSFALTFTPRQMAFKLGEALDIRTTDSKELVERLAKFEPKDLIDASREVFKNENTADGKMNAFVPSVEADVGQERFLPADPWVLLKTGKLADVPVMSGITKDEAIIFLGFLMKHVDMLNTHFENFVPYQMNATGDKLKEIGAAMKKFYFNDKLISKDTPKEFTMMLNDVWFNSGVLLTNKIVNSRISSPLYEYLFTFEGPFGVMKNLFKVNEGVAHGDELGYLFYSNVFKNKPAPNAPTEKMTRIVTKLWTNFAKDGNPTSKMDDDIKINWEPRGNDGNYMEINEDLKMDKNVFKERVDFWIGLYKDILGEFA